MQLLHLKASYKSEWHFTPTPTVSQFLFERHHTTPSLFAKIAVECVEFNYPELRTFANYKFIIHVPHCSCTRSGGGGVVWCSETSIQRPLIISINDYYSSS